MLGGYVCTRHRILDAACVKTGWTSKSAERETKLGGEPTTESFDHRCLFIVPTVDSKRGLNIGQLKVLDVLELADNSVVPIN